MGNNYIPHEKKKKKINQPKTIAGLSWCTLVSHAHQASEGQQNIHSHCLQINAKVHFYTKYS